MIQTTSIDQEGQTTDITPGKWIEVRSGTAVEEGLSKTNLQFSGPYSLNETRQSVFDSTEAIGVGMPSQGMAVRNFNSKESAPPPSKSGSIYFRDEPISADWRRAVKLLDQGRSIVAAAIEVLDSGDLQKSDELVMDFKQYLPELFCLRSISDSFGNVVNAITNGFANRRGEPLGRGQLIALDDILRSLLKEPAMQFERSVEIIMEFEDSGFAVESAALGGFLDLVRVLNQEFKLEDVEN